MHAIKKRHANAVNAAPLEACLPIFFSTKNEQTKSYPKGGRDSVNIDCETGKRHDG